MVEERVNVLGGQVYEKEEELALVRYELSGLRVGTVRNRKPVLVGASGSKKRKATSVMADDNEENPFTTDGLDGPENVTVESIADFKRERQEIDRKIALLEFKLASVTKEVFRTRVGCPSKHR